MTIEALYTVRFGHAGAENVPLNGGVVVLETQRLFGGDTWFAYTGKYEVDGDDVTGSLHVARHFADPQSQSAWGTQENAFDIEFAATLNAARTAAVGTLRRGDMELVLELRRFAELP